jgi:hypothetical protein
LVRNCALVTHKMSEPLALPDVYSTDLMDATVSEESLIIQVRGSSIEEYKCLLLRTGR